MKSVLSVLLFSLFAFHIVAQSNVDAINKKHFNLQKGVALEGYDAVSYFNGNKPVKGKSNIQASSGGVLYYFSSENNKDIFLQNPEKYKPQYGGWCAYAMGNSGEKVEVDPENYKILNCKLYLFYNAYFNNTLTSWNKDEAALKTKADANWKSIFK
jgi:YHS domain-containing protein